MGPLPEDGGALLGARALGEVLDLAPDGMLVLDADGVVIVANRRAEQLFGRARGALAGLPLERLVPGAEADRPRYTRRAPGLADDWQLDLEGHDGDGEAFPVDLRMSSAAGASGPLTVATVRHVRERPASEAQIHALLDNAPDGILLSDGGGRIVLANPRAEELFGFPSGQLVGRDVDELVPALRADHREGRDLLARRADGSEFPVEISLSSLPGDRQTLTMATIRDVGERQALEQERIERARAEAAATRSALEMQRLESLQAISDEALTSPAPHELMQVVVGRVRGALGADCAAIATDDGGAGLILRAVSGRESVEPVRVDESASAIIRAAGGPTGSCAAVPLSLRDLRVGMLAVGAAEAERFETDEQHFLGRIAERVALAISQARLTEALRIAGAEASDAEARMREILGDVVGVVWEADEPERRRHSFVSGSAAALLGHPPSAWTEREGLWLDLLDPADRDATLGAARAAVAAGRDHELEYRLRAADGTTRWIHDQVRIATPAEGGGLRLRGLMVDVSRRRELEGQLLHAQRLEAVGRLAAGIAHDFNNLTSAIVVSVEMLGGRMDAAEDRADLLEIKLAARHGQRLIEQLLAFSRPTHEHTKIVDLKHVLGELELLLRRLVPDGIDLVVATGARPAIVRADRGQIEQAVMNLVANARDAIEPPGHIVVGLDGGEPSDATVALSVSDSGTGMPEDVQSRIFDPFFTTKADGTGLGLSTTRDILEKAGGAIAVRSTPGTGTTITLMLPREAVPSSA